MSTTSTEDFERSCDQVFNKLQELAQELKSHDHEEIHFNIEHAAQYVEHNKIGVKFKEQVRLLNGDVSYELICAINDCNTHLNDCMSICKRMGTPSWSTEQDSRLTMSWTFVYASLSKAGLILKLKPLEAQAFLAFNRQQPARKTLPLRAEPRDESAQNGNGKANDGNRCWSLLREQD
uniref:Fungal N-terminal domain-containing protein n=1 Tax=Fusarium oxysporum (strain Fo5176) TaxID=660025 RepID=A0A0D2YAF8_FUSOF